MKKSFFKQLKYKEIVIPILFVIIATPLILNWVLPFNLIPTHMGLDGWLGFWGSFIGGVFSAIALWITIQYAEYQGESAENFTKTENEKLKKETELLRKQQLRMIEIEIEKDGLDRKYEHLKRFVDYTNRFLSLIDLPSENNHHKLSAFLLELNLYKVSYLSIA